MKSLELNQMEKINGADQRNCSIAGVAIAAGLVTWPIGGLALAGIGFAVGLEAECF